MPYTCVHMTGGFKVFERLSNTNQEVKKSKIDQKCSFFSTFVKVLGSFLVPITQKVAEM